MENNQQAKTDSGESTFEPGKVLNLVVVNWGTFLVSVVGCVALALIYLRYATPEYKIHAELLIEDQQTATSSIFNSSNVGASFGDMFNIQSSVDNEAEILKTRDIMEKVVRDLNLNIKYLNKGRVHAAELWTANPYRVQLFSHPDSIRKKTEQYSIKFLANSTFKLKDEDEDVEVTGRLGDTIRILKKVMVVTKTGTIKPEVNYGFRLAPLEATVALYMDNLNVNVTSKTVSTIAIDFNSNLQKKGEKVLNTLIDDYINSNRQAKNTIADSTIAFIDDRLALVNDELSGIETNVQSFKQKNKIANIDAQSNLIVTNSSDYYNQLNTLEVQRTMAKTMLEYMNDQKNNTRPVPSLSGTPDPVFGALIERYNSLLAQKDRLLLNNTEANPYVQNVTDQLKNVRQDLYNNLINQQKNLEIARTNLVNQNSTIAGTINKIPAQERQFLDLSRQMDIKQALYSYLLQKKEEMEVTKASNMASARVIDSPKSDAEPFSPKKIITLACGLLLGLIAPFGFFYLKQVLSTKIANQDDITKLTQVPVIAEIGHNKADQTIVMEAGARTPLSEQFRALRTNLQFFVNNSQKSNTILFTSSMAGEGKSFVSINLALALAYSGKKVLLMELDLRKPNLSNKLDIKRDIGFTNFIISTSLTPMEVSVPSKVNENLDFISSGPIPPNPSEIILNPRMEMMMSELKKDYDYIILDAPPVGLVTDAQLLSKYADMTIYVTRQNYTFKKQMKIPEDIRMNAKMKQITIVLNDVDYSKEGYGGYGYQSGYAYGYGYGIEPEKKSVFRVFLPKKKRTKNEVE